MLSINKKIILFSLGVFVLMLTGIGFIVCNSGINAFADELNSKVNITYLGEKHIGINYPSGIIGTYWDSAIVDVDYSLGDTMKFDLDLYDPAGKEDAIWCWENDKYQRHKITLSYERYGDGSYPEHYCYDLSMSDSCPDRDDGVNGIIYWKDGSKPTHFDIDIVDFCKSSSYPLPEINYIVFRANE